MFFDKSRDYICLLCVESPFLLMLKLIFTIFNLHDAQQVVSFTCIYYIWSGTIISLSLPSLYFVAVSFVKYYICAAFFQHILDLLYCLCLY